MMNPTNCLLAALSLVCLAGCSNSNDQSGPAGRIGVFPDYSVINAPPDDPDRSWYVSDYFRSPDRWEPETTDYGNLDLGMYELTRYPNETPSPAHEEAAESLLTASFDAVVRHGWLSKEAALRDGYEKLFGDPVHFVNKEYVYDGETLNPEKPEVLMYYKSQGNDHLLGVMFLAVGRRGPQVAGPLSKWHYHIDRGMCYELGVLPVGRYEAGGSCKAGVPNIRSPEMLHVWFFDHPGGRFATSMGLSAELMKAGVEQILQLKNERL